ncbi:basic salivary proline-rich protein 1 isoform X1 [Drosophila miranda]|uniref:basic salivary proline-rich protein 1 isoform X1 n=2 Tax=Drosophila miranda TaxID=7229 RepID=UPI0007E8A774|nr:basic salivary proline-rich protein 1 isoform X1 [Drosophila miranda]
MASRRRADLNPKLHMDRQPTAARITDPSLPAGKRREIDNVMKKARANTTNDYWDKKLIEAEEKDPNRWRHTGYKKMYIQGESSSGDSDREPHGVPRPGEGAPPPYGRYPPGGAPPGPPPRFGRSRSPHSRSRSGLRKSPPLSPPPRRRSPLPPMHGMDRRGGPRSPPMPRSPNHDTMMRRPGNGHGRPRSPPEPSSGSSSLRRKPNASRSPLGRRRSPPLPPPSSAGLDKRSSGHILPRSKRPPSPPPRHSMRSRSNSSMSSSSDDSCSLCSPSHRHRSRSRGPRSPPPKPRGHYRAGGPPLPPPDTHGRVHGRPSSPPPVRGSGSVSAIDKYRDAKMRHLAHERGATSEAHMKVARSSRHSPPPEDPRLKHRPPEPPEPAATAAAASAPQAKKKKKEKEQVRPRIKIEGEKRKKPAAPSGSGGNANSSSGSDDSCDSDSDEVPSVPTFSATTRLTLSERFGKMAQWSIDRSNMENMRITKDSAGGALKVMIEEGLESPPRRYSYSPAPAGHFPEELATTAPSGMLSWDDVRVRYEYYKSRGYLRDLDLKDYIKWEEWWYKYQEWLKQERYYEYWDRSQQLRRRRKKLPVTQRLN